MDLLIVCGIFAVFGLLLFWMGMRHERAMQDIRHRIQRGDF